MATSEAKTQAVTDGANGQKQPDKRDFNETYANIARQNQTGADGHGTTTGVTPQETKVLQDKGLLAKFELAHEGDSTRPMTVRTAGSDPIGPPPEATPTHEVTTGAPGDASGTPTKPPESSWFQRFENVAGEVLSGAVDEVIHHPLRVLENAAIGVGVGVAAAFVAPEIAVAAGVAGLGYAGYQVATHIGGWVHDAEVLATPEGYSKEEVAKAKEDAHSFGAGAVDVAAGIAGGVAGGYMGSALKTSLAARATSEVAPAAEVPKAKWADLSPEEQLKASIAENQGVFKSAGSDVTTAAKADYNVSFKKIMEPGTVKTLENPAGQTVSPGQWLATRLNADGTPNIENGMLNQWPVTEKTILKAYQTTPEQLSSLNELIAATKTDGPPVHMVKLTSPIQIKTSWGEMTGQIGDWLANYDFDVKNWLAGKDYAIVSKLSFMQTYKDISPK